MEIFEKHTCFGLFRILIQQISATFSEIFWTERGKFPFEKKTEQKVYIWISIKNTEPGASLWTRKRGQPGGTRASVWNASELRGDPAEYHAPKNVPPAFAPYN